MKFGIIDAIMIRKILASVVSVMVLMSLKAEDLSSRVYLGSIPSVSADGSFFVFEWCDRIWRASSSGGEAVALTDGMTRDIRPILSPDSKRMAFLSNRNGGWKLFESKDPIFMEIGAGLILSFFVAIINEAITGLEKRIKQLEETVKKLEQR